MKLNIKMENLILSKDIFQPNDTLRVTITTLPDEQNQSFNVDAKNIDDFSQIVTFKVSELIKKMIIIIRRKSIAKKDPIIASMILRSDQIPTSLNDKSNEKTNNILIYEPFPKDYNNQNSILENRKILGNVDIQFTVSELHCENEGDKHQNNQKHQTKLRITKENVVMTPN